MTTNTRDTPHGPHQKRLGQKKKTMIASKAVTRGRLIVVNVFWVVFDDGGGGWGSGGG